MPHKVNVGGAQLMGNVVFGSCEQIVLADDVLAFSNEAFTKVGAEEAGAAGD
jgi:hypothetical protein